jgi:hypothetical protein
MPNWCENNLYAYGDKDDITSYANKINQTLQDHDSILEGLYPVPSGVLKFEERKSRVPYTSKDYKEHVTAIEKECETFYGVPNAYEWRCVKWGSKWADCETDVSVSDDCVAIYFNSAWSPPLPGMLFVSKLFPNLTFVLRYEEPSMDFWGVVGFRNGQVAISKEGSFDIFAKEPRPDDDEDIDEYWELAFEWRNEGMEGITKEVTSYVLSEVIKS